MRNCLSLFLSAFLMILSCPLAHAEERYKGTLEKIFVDDFQEPQIIHRLRFKNGSVRKLEVPENFNYKEGSALTIEAEDLGDVLKVTRVLPRLSTFKLNGSANDANGNLKILVVTVTDASYSETNIPYTTDEIREMYFGSSKSVADYFGEASSGRASFTGELIGTLSIPNLCASDNLFWIAAAWTFLCVSGDKTISKFYLIDYQFER